MSRVQLALNVSDIDEAVEFYSKLFGTEPAKRQPGYANFAIADPPLKLVLIEDRRARGHGIEGPSTISASRSRRPTRSNAATAGCIDDRGSPRATEDNTTCCYAVQDKVWVDDPDGAPWEVYTVLADAPSRDGPRRRRVVLRTDVTRRDPVTLDGARALVLLLSRRSACAHG